MINPTPCHSMSKIDLVGVLHVGGKVINPPKCIIQINIQINTTFLVRLYLERRLAPNKHSCKSNERKVLDNYSL